MYGSGKTWYFFARLSYEVTQHAVQCDPLSKRNAAFVTNLLFRGSFHFLKSSNNSLIKTLRNIAAHDSVIYDLATWRFYANVIMPTMLKNYSVKRIQDLKRRVVNNKEVILFDRQTEKKVNNAVTTILIDDPVHFLKRLVTMCHLLIYALGYTDKLVLSRTMWVDEWKPQYERTETYSEMTVPKFQEELQADEISALDADNLP